MRRSEIEDVAYRWNPWFLGLLAIVTGAAGNQATHGVGDDDDLFDWCGPDRDHRREQVGQTLSVVGDVKTGVVAQVQRRVAGGGETRAVGDGRVLVVLIGVKLPGVLRFTQSVEEHCQLWRGLGVDGLQPVTSDPDVAATGTQSHPDRQGAVGVAQLVADGGVESGDRQIRSFLRCGRQSGDLRRHSADQPAGGQKRSPDTTVRGAGNGVVSGADRGTPGHRSGRSKEVGRYAMVGLFDVRHRTRHGPSSRLTENLSLLWCHRWHPPDSDGL